MGFLGLALLPGNCRSWPGPQAPVGWPRPNTALAAAHDLKVFFAGWRVGGQLRDLHTLSCEAYTSDVSEKVPDSAAHDPDHALSDDSETHPEVVASQDASAKKSRKLPNWAKFTIGAVVTAVIGIVVPSLYSALKDAVAVTLPPNPILEHVSQIVGPGWEVTVPDPQRLSPLVNDIGGCAALHAAAVQAGGADDYGSTLTILVQGNTSSGVTITGMHVHIIRRGAPLGGAFVFCQSAGIEEALPINFNLNQSAPVALGPPKSFGSPPGPSFFANGSVVHLNDGEVFPFKVGATISAGSSVQWVIEATVVIDGKTGTVTITDNGRPFETTASLPLSDYSDLYEYDWAMQDRLLHYRADATNPDGCAANLALHALRTQGLTASAQVLTVDCSSDLAHVEVWVPSERCIVHYLGFHRGSAWTFFASRSICPGNNSIGALFSQATIAHFGGSPQAFENAFGPYIVSSSAIPANPGPYDHVPQLSVQALAQRAGCSSVELSPRSSAEGSASQTGTCEADGVGFLVLTFKSSLDRNDFAADQYDSSSLPGRVIAGRSLLVIGPTWLVFGGPVSDYIEGLSPVQFARHVGGEAGVYEFAGAGHVFRNEVPTIQDGLL